MTPDDCPNRIPWPPIIVVVTVLAAVAAHNLYPLTFAFFTNTTSGRMIGVLLMGAGFALDIAALVTMRRARTNILPHRPADKLLTHGVFSVSRNPIYLGNTVLLLGAAGAFQIGWFAIFAAIAAIGVDKLAIRREEGHLAHKFGAAWADYVEKVPRWLIV